MQLPHANLAGLWSRLLFVAQAHPCPHHTSHSTIHCLHPAKLYCTFPKLTGYPYSFDDVADGGLPAYMGLKIQGLRVTRSDTYPACDGRSGYRHGMISPPNVAYSLQVGATDDLTNLVRIEAPTKDQKISVYKFWATAAWQVSTWTGLARRVVLRCCSVSSSSSSTVAAERRQ